MRRAPEFLLVGAMSVFAITGVIATALSDDRPVLPLVEPPVATVMIDPPIDAQAWFEQVRHHCNPVEVQSGLDRQPPPATPEGSMYEAACWALAGRIDRASAVIDLLPPGRRYQAAGVVFEAGHPAADAGGEVAAGPLMELVVRYWPGHAMALYHAGAARFESGSYQGAEVYLERFLEAYPAEDGWRASARSMLGQIAGSKR